MIPNGYEAMTIFSCGNEICALRKWKQQMVLLTGHTTTSEREAGMVVVLRGKLVNLIKKNRIMHIKKFPLSFLAFSLSGSSMWVSFFVSFSFLQFNFFPYSFLPFHPSFSYSDLHRFNLLSLSRKATIIHTSHSLPLVSFLLSFPPLLSFPFYCWCVAFLFSSFPFFCPCFPPSTSNIPSLISPFHSPSSPFSYLTIFFFPFILSYSYPRPRFVLPFSPSFSS